MAGIYLHIPFCKQACYYCDFHFSTNVAIRTDLVKAMGEEILLQQSYLGGEQVETIYFGGGTPSLLSARELEHLLRVIYDTHPVHNHAEITLEANPDDLTSEKLADMISLGINRLSIGVQSFDDQILAYLHRAHTAQTAIASFEVARKAGFENISIDLIYAIPGLTPEHWKNNLRQATALEPQHISAYTLTIEEKTTFGNWLAKGKLKPVDEALAAGQQEILTALLTSAGFRHYEISNFALPGFESRHNSAYWRGDKYLGIGPSAHSYDQVSRQHNVANNYQYVRSIAEKKVPSVREVLKQSDQINEYILTSLRTEDGCNLDTLNRDFSYNLLTLHGAYIRDLQNHHLVTLDPPHLRLTEAGKLLADKISSDLFLIE